MSAIIQNYKPILYSTEMVQAFLAGRKKQTRRMSGLQSINKDPNAFGLGKVRFNGYFNFYKLETEKGSWVMPKYQEGDIVWIRETFCKVPLNDFGIEYAYKADFDSTLSSWKPSIHMPKEAARLFHKITKVRCERLMNISEKDAVDEGIILYRDLDLLPSFKNYRKNDGEFSSFGLASNSYFSLWDKINGVDSFKKNPWVWVYEFEQIEKPEGWPL